MNVYYGVRGNASGTSDSVMMFHTLQFTIALTRMDVGIMLAASECLNACAAGLHQVSQGLHLFTLFSLSLHVLISSTAS